MEGLCTTFLGLLLELRRLRFSFRGGWGRWLYGDSLGIGNRSSGIAGLGEVDAEPRHVQVVVGCCGWDNDFDWPGAVMYDPWVLSRRRFTAREIGWAVVLGLLVVAAIYELVDW